MEVQLKEVKAISQKVLTNESVPSKETVLEWKVPFEGTEIEQEIELLDYLRYGNQEDMLAKSCSHLFDSEFDWDQIVFGTARRVVMKIGELKVSGIFRKPRVKNNEGTSITFKVSLITSTDVGMLLEGLIGKDNEGNAITWEAIVLNP